jgi:protoheme IX farnesyltransferase
LPVLASVRSESEVADWIALLKPRVMSLVVFTGLIGLLVAPGRLHPVLAFAAVLCIAVGAGACGAINMWYDRDIDALMRRTRNRPIPAGRMDPDAALSFGVVLAVASVLTMFLATNWVAAAVLTLSIVFYVFVYTIGLKRRTPQNIVIGGAAGSIPPLVGWAAVTHAIGGPALGLFAIIFLWTPPHFWALALMTETDYHKANIPMLPNVYGDARTKKEIFWYTLALVAASIALYFPLHVMGPLYAVAAAVLGAVFLKDAAAVLRDDTKASARKMFLYSLLYLALICAFMVIDRIVF